METSMIIVREREFRFPLFSTVDSRHRRFLRTNFLRRKNSGRWFTEWIPSTLRCSFAATRDFHRAITAEFNMYLMILTLAIFTDSIIASFSIKKRIAELKHLHRRES